MKYGIMGGFIKFAFAKTSFEYIEKEIPEMNMASYKKRVLKEYRAIVERTPGIGSMKDNMFVMTMYAGAFLIALYKEADGRMDEEKLKGLVRAASYCPLMVMAKTLEVPHRARLLSMALNSARVMRGVSRWC